MGWWGSPIPQSNPFPILSTNTPCAAKSKSDGKENKYRPDNHLVLLSVFEQAVTIFLFLVPVAGSPLWKYSGIILTISAFVFVSDRLRFC